MEGITGVVDWCHVDWTHPEYQRTRRLMTGDINAAIRGASAAGVDQIVVTDGHHHKFNVLIEELDPRARYNSGSPSPLGMVEGIDQGVDAAFFIGYHARSGAQRAILAHTMSSSKVSNIWLNDRVVGEIGLNAALCGYFKVPVLMISGDQAACDEASQWVNGIETAVVKKASAYSAAECLPPSLSQQLIEETAIHSVQHFKERQTTQPVQVIEPVKIGIEFLNSGMADNASLMPLTTRLDGRTIEFQGETMALAYRYYRAAVMLGG